MPRSPQKRPASGAQRSATGGDDPPVSNAEIPSLDEIEARLSLDDHSGALELSRKRLAALPSDRKTAGYLRRCEDTLMEMYSSRIGDFSQRVKLSMTGSELQWLSIDHRAGFLVAQVDGAITVEELLEICGMPKLDALRILQELLQQKVITLESGRRGR